MRSRTSPRPDEVDRPVVGVVLAGGRSRRMGRDKATLRVAGTDLVRAAADRLSRVCARVVAADGERHLLAGVASLADGPGRGPAAGILGAAARDPGHPLLVLACDLPGVTVELLRELARPGAASWTVPRWQGRLEPLSALYRPAALSALARRVAEGRFALHGLEEVPGLAVHYLEGEALEAFGRPEALFRNLNTPEELAAYELLVGRAGGSPPRR